MIEKHLKDKYIDQIRKAINLLVLNKNADIRLINVDFEESDSLNPGANVVVIHVDYADKGEKIDHLFETWFQPETWKGSTFGVPRMANYPETLSDDEKVVAILAWWFWKYYKQVTA